MIEKSARAIVFGFLTLALSSTLVVAQDYRRENYQDFRRNRNSHEGTPGQFDFYVLSLSWSPSFCETSGGGRNNEQCSQGRPFAFVVHGLWPQYDRGFPQNCERSAPWIDNRLIRSMLDVMPARQLVIHEWRTHGTCSGLTAEKYFETVRSAYQRVKVPERFQRLNEYTMVSPEDIEEAFAAANPGLARDMISVTCDSRHLREVRVCMSKDLAFRACPETDRRACRTPRVVMPPVRGS
jgi:ribonuclease T2